MVVASYKLPKKKFDNQTLHCNNFVFSTASTIIAIFQANREWYEPSKAN